MDKQVTSEDASAFKNGRTVGSAWPTAEGISSGKVVCLCSFSFRQALDLFPLQVTVVQEDADKV
jgi:hypothetical protein